MKIAKTTYEVSIQVSTQLKEASDVLISLITSFGIPLSDIIQQDNISKRFISVYLTQKTKARRLYNLLANCGLKKVKVLWKEHIREDWLNKWKEDFKPFLLTQTIEVIPVWLKNEYVPKKTKTIYLDTICAFGTGLHETTRFVSNFIEDKRGKFSSFFDIGSGTGILSIVARYNDAELVHALDIDPETISVAQENISINGMSFDKISVSDIAFYRAKKTFDFVAANIITDELLKNAQKIVHFVKDGGYLALSGISLPYLKEIQQKYKKYSLTCLKVQEGKKWAAILYKK